MTTRSMFALSTAVFAVMTTVLIKEANADDIMKGAFKLGQKQVLKQAEGVAKSNLQKVITKAAGAATKATGTATTATDVKPAAAATSTSTAGAATSAGATKATAVQPKSTESLKDKLQKTATDQATKYGTKYGKKYVEGGLGKLLK